MFELVLIITLAIIVLGVALGQYGRHVNSEDYAGKFNGPDRSGYQRKKATDG